jgi:hypothetical protein
MLQNKRNLQPYSSLLKYLSRVNVNQFFFAEKNNLEERFILPHSFRGFSPWPAGSIVSGFVIKQNILAEGHGAAKLLSACWPGSRDRESDKGQDIPLQGMLLSDLGAKLLFLLSTISQ